MNLFDLTGRVAIVTGSTKGIGRGIAENLAAAGAQVVVTSRSQEDCDRAAAEINARHADASGYGARCDVADADSIRALVEHVTERSGGIVPAPHQLAYSCAKAAETHLARNLAAHLASNNIRVNCIAPGLIRSDSSSVVFDNPVAIAAFERDIPLRRGGEPYEIGGAVVFLASAAGAYITGVTLPIDGGVVGLPPSPGVTSPTFDVTRGES